MTTIVTALTVAVASVVLAACQGTERRPAASPASPTHAGPTHAATSAGRSACPAGGIGPVDAGSVLVPGPGNGVPRSTAHGVRLVIVGVVLDAACRPAAGASIHLWHTDARGHYGPAGDECCYYQGTVRTDRDGRFQLETIRPGQYADASPPPAHIHMEVRHGSSELLTELVFAGDDGVPPPAMAGTVPVALREAGGGSRSWYGEAALVLQP